MTQDAAPRSGTKDLLLYGPYGLRAGWRILGLALLAAGAAVVLTSFAQVLRLPMEMAATFAIGLLAALLAGWAMLAGVDRRRPGALGFALEPAAARDSVVGLGIGGALLGGAVVVLAMAS